MDVTRINNKTTYNNIYMYIYIFSFEAMGDARNSHPLKIAGGAPRHTHASHIAAGYCTLSLNTHYTLHLAHPSNDPSSSFAGTHNLSASLVSA